MLDVDVPMISAVNGPCNMHSEVPIMGDIVLASEDAYFQDASHFPRGQVPGDGQHVIWSVLAGHNRARYFLLTGQKLSAQEAKEWGVVNEVLPKDKLLDRAWEHARELVKRPPLTLRYTRQLFTNPLKRAFVNELGHGLGRETYAQRAFFPFGGEMAPLDRPWDQQPWTNANGQPVDEGATTMTGIQQKLATGRGKFTTDYPELGTGPVNYEDSISEEFFAAERKAVFERNWLCVGRMERLPRKGSYFTRELPGRLASIVITRDLDDNVYAFHNVCAHRGNKVVWQEHPPRRSAGSCRAFSCKYHGWRYGLNGVVNHITNEEEFFDLDKSKLRMPPVHCEVWAGFIFVNLAEDPEPLRTFLGEGLLGMEDYPFHLMTQHYGFSTQIKGNWKLAVDSVCEWYHPPYVHGRFIDPDVSKAEKMVPPIDSYHYDLFRPHMLTSVPGPPILPPREPGSAGEARQDQRWVYKLFRAGLFGPDDVPDIGPLPELPQPRRHRVVGQRPVLGLPEHLDPDLGAQLLHHLHVLAGDGRHPHLRDRPVLRAAGQRARAAGAGSGGGQHHRVRDAGRQHDRGHALGAEDPRAEHLPPQRPGAAHPAVPHGHPRNRRRPPGRSRSRGVMMGTSLPEGFSELEPWVDDWALATRAERYAARLDRPFDDLVAFYDGIAPHAERAIAYLDGLDINALAPRTHQADAPAVLDDPGVLRGEHLQAEPDPGLGRRILRHGRRTGPVSQRCRLSGLCGWSTPRRWRPGRWWRPRSASSAPTSSRSSSPASATRCAPGAPAATTSGWCGRA